MLPSVSLLGTSLTRLICGGNPFSGFSHADAETDEEMKRFYTMPNLLSALFECEKNGINTFQARGDRHIMRMLMEFRENGGKLNWIAQIASELSDHAANAREILRHAPAGIFYHGTYIDRLYHEGRLDEALPVIDFIKDAGAAAGVGTHIPGVVFYCEKNKWPVDFYMASVYNLAKTVKPFAAVDPDPYRKDAFDESDPPLMFKAVREVDKPCLVFKVLACGRHCFSRERVKEAFAWAYKNIKDTDAVVAGMFQKNKNQVAENATIVRELLTGGS